MTSNKKKTILLVDNESIIAANQAITIESFGYNVVTAASGERAVELATRDDKIDLILMDIDLGKGISGPEAAGRILARREMPVVFLTSHAERAYVEMVKEITRYGYVIKDSGDFVLQSSIDMAFELFASHEALRQSEEALREKDLIFQAFLKNSPIYVFFKDSDIRSIYLSRNYEKMLGMPLEDILGKTMDELFPSDLARSMIEDDKKILKEGKLINVEEELDGRYYTTIKFPIKLENKPPMLAGFTIDVTERRIMEENLQYSELKYRTLFESSSFFSYITDDKGTILTANNRGAEFMGESPQSIIGKSFFDLQPDRSVIYQNILDSVLSKGEAIQFETLFPTPKGDVWLFDTISPFRIGDNTRLQIIAQDITKRKKAEEQIKSLLNEKDLLIKEIHHRVKNNMAVTRSLLSLQARSVADTEAASILKNAVSRVESMSVLYDILYQSDNYRELSLNNYLSRMIEEIYNIYPVSNSIKIEKDIENISIDAKTILPLGMIVNELITNSIKHAFPGGEGGIIRITAGIEGERIRLVLEDNGAGLPGSVSGEKAGSGLKLVRLLANQLGGTLNIIYNGGARFVLDFNK